VKGGAGDGGGEVQLIFRSCEQRELGLRRGDLVLSKIVDGCHYGRRFVSCQATDTIDTGDLHFI
jgi:hypothetical protein